MRKQPVIITNMRRIVVSLLITLSCPVFYLNINAYAENNIITVYCDKEVTRVNKMVFGNNLIAYDPLTYENRTKAYYGYSDYGAGIWDPERNKPQIEVIGLARNAGITAVRFPGGCGTHHYDWRQAVGKDRERFLYGIDEFLETCRLIGAEPIITVSFFTGSAEDAEDFVRYLNSKVRRVKYFEIGNEVWHGNHRDIKKLSPEEYAQKYLEYYGRMKTADPFIQIGIVLYTPEWNKKVMGIVRDRLDFAIIHTYPTPAWGKRLEAMKAKDIFSISLAMPVFKDEYNFQEALTLLKEKSGKEVPLAITEYNGGFAQDKPIPYRHCLGTALINAELLRIFMKPEHNILMANYWNFVNEYWGMISNGFNGDPKDLSNPYYKRPNYYVYELYHKHFGDILLETGVKSNWYSAGDYKPFLKEFIQRLKKGEVVKNNLLKRQWQVSFFDGAEVQEKNGILEISFNNPKAFNYYHSIKKSTVEPNTYYKLSGYIKTEGLVDKNGVCLEVQDGRGWVKTHSSAVTEKIKGTKDWQYVEAIYGTLADAKAVNVIVRRVGDEGPLKGRAFIKDVRLEKFIPDLDTKQIPYLNVNASKNIGGDKIYLVVINKNLEEPLAADISIPGFKPAKSADAWVLNGPSVDATNEKNRNNVTVAHKAFELEGDTFKFTFEPHSLTAIEIERGI